MSVPRRILPRRRIATAGLFWLAAAVLAGCQRSPVESTSAAAAGDVDSGVEVGVQIEEETKAGPSEEVRGDVEPVGGSDRVNAAPDPAAASDWFDGPRALDEPSLSLVVNPDLGQDFVAGWPLVVQAQLIHAGPIVAGDSVLTIAVKERPWTDAIRIELQKDGETAEWPLQLATQADPRLTLDAEHGGLVTWFLPPEESARVAAGEYEFVAVFDTSSGALPGTWRGRIESVPITVTVRRPHPPLRDDSVLRRHAFLRYYLLRGKRSEARAEVDALLRDDPEQVLALALKSDFLAEDGQFEAALDLLTRAIDHVYKTDPDGEEPPLALLERQGALLDKLLVPADTVFPEQPSSPPARAHTGGGLSEDDLIDLIELEVGDEVILRRIEEVGLAFTPGEDPLKRLEAAGASRNLITALGKVKHKSTAPLSVQDLVDLLTLEIEERTILDRLQQSGVAPLDEQQRNELRRAGASEQLIEAVERSSR